MGFNAGSCCWEECVDNRPPPQGLGLLFVRRVAKTRDAKAVFLIFQLDAIERHQCNVEHKEGGAQEGIEFNKGYWLQDVQ